MAVVRKQKFPRVPKSLQNVFMHCRRKRKKTIVAVQQEVSPHTYRMHNLSNILHTFPVANGFLWVFIRILTEHNVLAAEIFFHFVYGNFSPLGPDGRQALPSHAATFFCAKIPKM